MDGATRRRLSAAHDLLYRLNVDDKAGMHDVVALLEDLRGAHFETGRAFVLLRGQIGTVVMTYEGPIVDVEFAGPDGRAYAILPVDVSKLIVLRDAPDHSAA